MFECNFGIKKNINLYLNRKKYDLKNIKGIWIDECEDLKLVDISISDKNLLEDSSNNIKTNFFDMMFSKNKIIPSNITEKKIILKKLKKEYYNCIKEKNKIIENITKIKNKIHKYNASSKVLSKNLLELLKNDYKLEMKKLEENDNKLKSVIIQIVLIEKI